MTVRLFDRPPDPVTEEAAQSRTYNALARLNRHKPAGVKLVPYEGCGDEIKVKVDNKPPQRPSGSSPPRSSNVIARYQKKSLQRQTFDHCVRPPKRIYTPRNHLAKKTVPDDDQRGRSRLRYQPNAREKNAGERDREKESLDKGNPAQAHLEGQCRKIEQADEEGDHDKVNGRELLKQAFRT